MPPSSLCIATLPFQISICCYQLKSADAFKSISYNTDFNANELGTSSENFNALHVLKVSIDVDFDDSYKKSEFVVLGFSFEF